MRKLVVLSLAVICVAASPALGGSAVTCSSPGDWPHTKDAAWLARALTRAGLGSFGCTGSAFVVDLGGTGSSGQIYVWTTRGTPGEPFAAHVRIGGVTVRHDAVRGVWRAQGRSVWVQTASAGPLLPVGRWARIVLATR